MTLVIPISVVIVIVRTLLALLVVCIVSLGWQVVRQQTPSWVLVVTLTSTTLAYALVLVVVCTTVPDWGRIFDLSLSWTVETHARPTPTPTPITPQVPDDRHRHD